MRKKPRCCKTYAVGSCIGLGNHSNINTHSTVYLKKCMHILRSSILYLLTATVIPLITVAVLKVFTAHTVNHRSCPGHVGKFMIRLPKRSQTAPVVIEQNFKLSDLLKLAWGENSPTLKETQAHTLLNSIVPLGRQLAAKIFKHLLYIHTKSCKRCNIAEQLNAQRCQKYLKVLSLLFFCLLGPTRREISIYVFPKCGIFTWWFSVPFVVPYNLRYEIQYCPSLTFCLERQSLIFL